MSQKQGGKGKQSSQSDKNYWARMQMSGAIAKHKAKRIERHEKRMAKKAAKRSAS